MTTITEAGNNLIAIQNRLLNERQVLMVEMDRQTALAEDLFTSIERDLQNAKQEFRDRMAFFDARIAEIDAMIGDKPEPMRMAAE